MQFACESCGAIDDHDNLKCGICAADVIKQKTMKKIFAYTKEANLTKKVIDQLAEAGYIPVPVASLDAIRIIEPLPDADATLLLNSAVEALLKSNDAARVNFATQTLTALANRNRDGKDSGAKAIMNEQFGELKKL